MARLPKFGEAAAMRMASIEKLGTHTPSTKAAWAMAERLERAGLVQRNPRGFELTEAGKAHMLVLSKQRLAAVKERGW